MRYLNKIIFINSARIQYAEIQIDGNVHFIGTQGVGKSTALRALLFFYNADKTKLGISKEKKSFDEYYFPYVNSYIIYEVVVDDASYCVLAFRSQGRVCFRFLGTGYKKEYFISPEGKAYEEWYNPQIQISAESETKRSIFREKDKTKRSKKESAQHSKSRNKSFVMTSVSAL